nr:transmembrane protein KIAA1109 [Ciona intestinalis]|eukprot:XP_026696686.1 transmembrane protein KIAA1109 [Ciona intestinalis]
MILVFGFLIQATYVAVATAQNTTTSFNQNQTAIPGSEVLPPNCSTGNDRLNLGCIDNSLRSNQSSLVQLFVVTSLSGLWILYLAYYNSRFFGLVLTKVINQFYKDAYIKIGSFSFSVLSGKLMFREVYYITTDYSLRIDDGYCIFRWWRPYEVSSWQKQKDLSQGHTRLSVVISNIRFHVYNRNAVYARLQTLFADKTSQKSMKETSKRPKRTSTSTNPTPQTPTVGDEIVWWRRLFPVIKCTISHGRISFGNKYLPNTLVVSFGEGDFQYKTTEASNPYDIFMHALEGTMGSLRLMLVPSLGYDPSFNPPMLGILPIHNEPPPRKMGEGYVIVRSNDVDVTFLIDEPGKVQSEPLPQSKETSDTNESGDPIWEIVLRFGKRSSLNYGPWADRQRELIWKFFYPPDFQPLEVTKAAKAGELRMAKSMRVTANLLKEAEIDILFTKDDEINAMHLNVSKGSFIDVDIPTVTTSTGYTSHIWGQFLFLDTTTSMQYRNLLKAETLHFDIKSHYPITWNAPQSWKCEVTVTKASIGLVFAHKDFISDLMDDWSSKSSPDLLAFVPYTFAFQFKLREFELILPSNPHNWMDCYTKAKENAYVGIYGRELSIGFDLPFDDFLPLTFSIPFKFNLHQAELCIFLPETNTSRHMLLNLAAGQSEWTAGTPTQDDPASRPHLISKVGTWGLIDPNEWVKCWEVPSLKLTLTYTWHPIVVTHQSKPFSTRGKQSILKQSSHSNVSTPELEERKSFSHSQKKPSVKGRVKTTVTFDPTSMESDEIRIDLEMTPGSTLYLYGSLLDLFLAIKENYFGCDDMYTDFASPPSGSVIEDKTTCQSTDVNLLQYRPLQVTLDVNLHDINGVLPIHYNAMYKGPPTVKLNLLKFEMDKNYHQTRLQLLLSNLEIELNDKISGIDGPPLGGAEGRISLPDLQLRGHAMFSGAGLPLGATTIEYGWLTEILVGPIKGKLTIPQVHALAGWAKNFVFLLKNEDHKFRSPNPNRYLPTGIVWDFTKKNGKPIDELDVKYAMNRIRIESLHLLVEEQDSIFDLLVAPVTVTNGNVQNVGISEASTIVAEDVKLKHRISMGAKSPPHVMEWMDAGEVSFGPLITQITEATEDRELYGFQDEFLRFHDRKTRRLDFLWDFDQVDSSSNRRKMSAKLNSLLENVRTMKSWGCAFFTALTTKHPTFYYDNEISKEKRYRHQTGRENTEETHCDVTDGQSLDDEEDVFDLQMDFGMSLLQSGKKVLTRSRTSTVNKSTSSQAEDTFKTNVLKNKSRPILKKLETVEKADAGFVLMNYDPTKDLKPQKSVSMQVSARPKLVKMKSLYSDDAAMQRAVSTESNLFQSAESDFKSSTSLSSDTYFSADSDIQDNNSQMKATASDSSVDFPTNKPTTNTSNVEVQRPHTLFIEEQNKPQYPPTEESNPTVDRNESTSRKTQKPNLLTDNEQLLACYKNFLPISTARVKDDEHPYLWMKEFDIVKDGIHPSIVIDKGDSEYKYSRRYSMDVLDQNDVTKNSCTNVKLHIKDSIDVQVSPFLLESLTKVVNTTSQIIAAEHPLSLLDQITHSCVNDAVKKYEDEKSDPDVPKDEPISEVGFRFQICMDFVRINVIQATLGQDSVFNLQLNKLSPCPCVSILTLRLDKVELEVDSKLTKEIKKMRSSHPSRTSSNDGNDDGKQEDSIITTSSSPSSMFIDFMGKTSVHSVVCQLRTMSLNGATPVRTSVTALCDDACHAPFHFDPKVMLPLVKESIDKHNENKDKWSQKAPPKPWGWVMIEGGIKRLKSDFVKKIPTSTSCTSDNLPDIVNEAQSMSSTKRPSAEHACHGELTIDLLWLNVVSPLHSTGRLIRTWNLLTTIGPSVSAWLGPADQLGSALELFEKTSQKRNFAAMTSLLTVALETATNDRAVAKNLCELTNHKHDVLEDVSKFIRNNPSYLLCTALHKFLRDSDHVTTIRGAVSDNREIPAPVTLEKGFLILIGQWSELMTSLKNEASGVKNRRKRISSAPLPMRQEHRIVTGTSIKYDGNLDIVMFSEKPLDPEAPTMDDKPDEEDIQILEEEETLQLGVDETLQMENLEKQHLVSPGSAGSPVSPIDKHINERAKLMQGSDVFYDQQHNMYSWMQGQKPSSDPKDETVTSPAPNESMNFGPEIKEADPDMTIDTLIQNIQKLEFSVDKLSKYQEMFSGFLTNAGASITEVEKSSSFVQSQCLGSLAVDAHLFNLRVDQQQPDRLYTRELRSRRKRREPSRRYKSRQSNKSFSQSKSAILLFQGFCFNSSIIDTAVVNVEDSNAAETKEKKSVNKNRNNNKKEKNVGWLEEKKIEKRSTMNVTLECSVDSVRQRVDIALVRLIHQFIQCSDAIQQARTLILVNKYTEGSISPDPLITHRKTVSNVSSASANSSFADYERRVITRRHTSPVPENTRHPTFDTGSILSSSTESESLARCWQILYKLVDLYSIDPDLNLPPHTLVAKRQDEFRVESERNIYGSSISQHGLLSGDYVPYVAMVVTATATINEFQLLAEVGELHLSVSLCQLSANAFHKQTSVRLFKREGSSSMHVSLAKVHGDVTEHSNQLKKVILTCGVGSCTLDASTDHQRDSDEGNKCSTVIGRIVLNLPQHPASLHDVVSRGTRHLSSHIMEFSQTPTYRTFDTVDGMGPGYPPATPSNTGIPMTPMTPSAITAFIDLSQASSETNNTPVIANFSLEAEGIEIGASLLPSLRAEYSTGIITGKGKIGPEAEFSVVMPKHSLYFHSESTPSNDISPVSTGIELPQISAEGESKHHNLYDVTNDDTSGYGDAGLQMKEGDYMSITIRMGSFEHTLTTDLLNQLIFLQEVFMSEVNDVIKKLSKDQIATSVWSESSLRSVESTQSKPMLYQLELQLDGIQITATTASSNAVRLKTGKMVFELSNRVIRAEPGKKIKSLHKYLKLFGKAQVDLTLSLGTLMANNVYQEAEAEFQQMAYFTTRIGLQNTSQQAHDGATYTHKSSKSSKSENLQVPPSSSFTPEDQMEDNNIILISLSRPIFFVQPTAFDKAILLFLAYKNAYDDWTEKRADLHEEVRHATQEVVGAIHARRMMNASSNTVAVSNLFLQLSVHDLGICLPVAQDTNSYDISTQEELSSALVLTVDNTLISACYAKSLVTRGNFKGFCLRFTDDFQTSWDDWNPGCMGSKNVVMNSFLVPAGTYEICTDTTSYQIHTDSGMVPTARTTVNIVWQMDGVDLEIDTKIGAYLTHLVETLTVITGDDASLRRDSSESDRLNYDSVMGSLSELDGTGLEDTVDGGVEMRQMDDLPSSHKELTQREKTKKLEQELNEQVRVVNDLKSLGAKPALIEEQVRKLHTLEVALSSIFRQTFRNKLRRSSTKQASSSFKRPGHRRSMSTAVGSRNLPPPKSAQSAFSTLPPSVKHNLLGDSSPTAWNFPLKQNVEYKEVFSPQPPHAMKDISSSDTSSADYDISEDEVDGGKTHGARRSLYLDDSMDGSHDLTHDRISLTQPQNISHMTTAGIEADLELTLDIRVEIQGGKIVCHPTKPSDPSSLSSQARPKPSDHVTVANNTTFFIPGVEVKVHYNSESRETTKQTPDSPQTQPGGSKIPHIQINSPPHSSHIKSHPGSRRACVYTWFSIQSLPEMIISPCFLDFLEQTFDAVPVTPTLRGSRNPSQKTNDSFDSSSEDDADMDIGAVEVFNTTMAALPVDVVVYVHVQPSQVFFNCQPMSRVECLLHVPSLDLVFSSIGGSALQTSPTNTTAFTYPDKDTDKFHNFSTQNINDQTQGSTFPNGISFTAIMSDFSLYVFHPYGTQQSVGIDISHNPNPARKDSLSINLEVVKINIVRTRRGNVNLDASQSGVKLTDQQKVFIHLSALLDIGKASFKYDMRRLSEILAFPRAWYRKSIARRIFFGDAASTNKPKEEETKRASSFLNQDPLVSPKRRFASHTSTATNDKQTEEEGSKVWQGVVLFGLRMSRLDVEMNMSNVMGHTVWSCDELKTNGKLNIHSGGDKNVFLSCGLKNSQLSARGGIIGGQIELQELHANCHLMDPEGKDPLHKILVKMHSLDGRIEYMGSCVMMGRLTSVNLKLSDEWKGPKLSIPTSIEKSAVFVPGNFGWDSFCLTISRSTTPDVIKMLSKLEEFFTQQFQNSVRAFTSWRHSGHLGAPVRRQLSVTTPQVTYSHRRHWPPVYTAISDTFRALGVAANPQFLLGGSMCLHGNELTVVCFHGSNFRSKSWVLFNILEPNIVFSTEVQQIKESVRGNETSTLAIQSLTFNLGHDHWLKTGGPSTDPMATVSRVTRSRHQNPPPSAASLDEWFAYVTASHNQELTMLRTLNDIRPSDMGVGGSPAGGGRRHHSSSSQASYNHDTDIIFALPKLQLDFKSEHMQGPNEPSTSAETENKPIVECSFVTEFTDHICVTMDVELIMFLHDLVSSYLKEKQIALSSRTRITSVGGLAGSQPTDHVTTIDPIDLREFVCNTWQLEPTVRLISWAGRRIEPVGVDYILQKLGFSHARTTIPKWFQRGVLDLLDQIIAVIVQNLVVTVTKQKHK